MRDLNKVSRLYELISRYWPINLKRVSRSFSDVVWAKMLTVRLAKRNSNRKWHYDKPPKYTYRWKIVTFYTISTKHWIWMCSLSGSFFTYFRSLRFNANRSADKLCNVARDQIINDICDNRVCQNYSKKSAKQQKRHLSVWFQRMVCSHLQENFGWSR